MIIYKWTNLVNGKIYIGQTTKTLAVRTRMHVNTARIGSPVPIHNAIRKYGAAAFKVEVVCTCTTREELNLKEEELIAYFDSLAPKGYNLKSGGHTQTWHPETRAKASASAKAAMNSARVEILKKGRQMLVGREPWNKGKKASDQALANQSLAHMGQAAWNKGVETPAAVREKQKKAAAKRAKAVRCVQTGEVWASIEEAAKSTGFTSTHIRRLAKSGKTTPKGLSFTFAVVLDTVDAA